MQDIGEECEQDREKGQRVCLTPRRWELVAARQIIGYDDDAEVATMRIAMV